MCESQGYMKCDCSGKCAGCGDHHQEKGDRAVPEKAEDRHVRHFQREIEKLFHAKAENLKKHVAELEDELATWRSVFPDVAPEQVQPERAEMRDRINELTKQRDVLAKRCGELESKLNQQEKDFNALLAGYRDSLRDGKISKVVASITTILIG